MNNRREKSRLFFVWDILENYTSSHTLISIPLYTTTILCNSVVPIAFFTVSVLA